MTCLAVAGGGPSAGAASRAVRDCHPSRNFGPVIAPVPNSPPAPAGGLGHARSSIPPALRHTASSRSLRRAPGRAPSRIFPWPARETQEPENPAQGAAGDTCRRDSPPTACAARGSLRTCILPAGTGTAGPGGAHNSPLCAGGRRRGEALTSAREEFLNAIQASLTRVANCILCNSCSWAPSPLLRVGKDRVTGAAGAQAALVAARHVQLVPLGMGTLVALLVGSPRLGHSFPGVGSSSHPL